MRLIRVIFSELSVQATEQSWQINKIGNNNEEVSYCPFDFGTSEFIQQHKTFTENWCLAETVVTIIAEYYCLVYLPGSKTRRIANIE